jgi:hypothetical protein
VPLKKPEGTLSPLESIRQVSKPALHMTVFIVDIVIHLVGFP